MNRSSSICPNCDTPLPDDSPGALCAACLMRQAFPTYQSPDGDRSAPANPVPSPEEIAGKLSQFEILECLGRGGMGVVYKARQKSLNRIVAVKILAPGRASEPRFAEHFAREAELLAQLSHPHIVTVHDFGEAGGLFYLVMEFVDGVNLRDLLREGKLEPQQALAIVPPICEALQYAHAKGIVHRDIKPENLLLDRDGGIKIADFGIAALVGSGNQPAGTPPYMAPEQQVATGMIDHRADIYALGVVLYEMLTGERPDKQPVAPSRKVQLDVRIDEMVLRALETQPERRYQTAGEFQASVEDTMATPPEPAAGLSGPGMFRRYGWLLLVMLPLGALIGWGIGALQGRLLPVRYEAGTVFEIKPEPGEPVLTRLAAFLSPSTFEEIAARLHRDQRWHEAEPAERLRGMIRIQQMADTDLFTIKAISPNPPEAREFSQAMTGFLAEKYPIIIHDTTLGPVFPGEKELRPITFHAILMGCLLSPLAAFLAMDRANRRRLGKQGIRPPHGWLAPVLFSLALAGGLLTPPLHRLARALLPAEAPDRQEIGRIRFAFFHPQAGGGHSFTLPVFRDRDSGWFPRGGQSFEIKDSGTLWIRSRVISTPGFPALALVSTSRDRKIWETREQVMQDGPPTAIDLAGGLRVDIEWKTPAE